MANLAQTTTKYGRYNHVGFKVVERGTYRQDEYISNDGTYRGVESHHCTGRGDFSRLVSTYGPSAPDKYDSACSCCYLGFSHTVNLHNSKSA